MAAMVSRGVLDAVGQLI
ncbi:hypothetical protein Tco_0100814, partial [Tanacetum coccineum]